MLLFQIIATRDDKSPRPIAHAETRSDVLDGAGSREPFAIHFVKKATAIPSTGAATNTVRNVRLNAGRFEHTTFQASMCR